MENIMKWNKKSVSMLAVLSLLLGGVGVIGSEVVHAQQNPTPTPTAQVQSQSAAVAEQEKGNEAKGGIEADENLPGGGHQDQDGVNVDHQFEGVE